MGAAFAWSMTLLLMIAGVVALDQLGLNIGTVVSASMHAVEHFLGQPLVAP